MFNPTQNVLEKLKLIRSRWGDCVAINELVGRIPLDILNEAIEEIGTLFEENWEDMKKEKNLI